MSDLVKALLSGQQCDEEGVMCIVSRQACHEAAARIEALEAGRDAAFSAGFEACREMALSKARCEFIETAAVRELQPEQHRKMEDE